MRNKWKFTVVLSDIVKVNAKCAANRHIWNCDLGYAINLYRFNRTQFKARNIIGMAAKPTSARVLILPGGRILKDKTIEDSFNRLLKVELWIGSKKSNTNIAFKGAYQYFYNDNVAGDAYSISLWYWN